LAQLKDALKDFHYYRQAFEEVDSFPGSLLPRQHSLIHYEENIRLFGAPNGLCTSITEAKHIKAVKEPWRRTNRYQLLNQMLCINQHLDKLYAMRTDFTNRGMLEAAGLRAVLDMIGVFSIHPLPYKSHSENTPEAMRVDLENPDDEANNPIYRSGDNDNDGCDDEYDDEDEDEANIGGVVVLTAQTKLYAALHSCVLHTTLCAIF
jgi:hypothetical protein